MINSTKIQRDLKEHKKSKCTHTINDDVDIQLVFERLTDEKVKITGYIRDRNNNNKRIESVKGSKTVRTSAMDKLDHDARSIVLKLRNAWKQHNKPIRSAKRVETEEEWQILANTIKEKHMTELVENPTNFKEYKDPGQKKWKESTIRGDVTYMCNTVFPKLFGVYDAEPTEADVYEFIENEIGMDADEKDSVLEAQRKDDGQTKGWNSRVDKLRRIQCILAYLADHHPELGCPRYSFAFLGKRMEFKKEKIKNIGRENYIRAVFIMLRLCEMGVPFAFAAVGELLCGMRVAESCAPLCGEFKLYYDEFAGVHYGSYALDHQVKKTTLERTNILKTAAAHRMVFFTEMMVRAVEMRKEQLRQYGHTEKEIERMPLAAFKSSPYTHLSPSRVSCFIKEVLQLAGCTETWIREKLEEIRGREKDDVEAYDLTAHILRRTLVTFFANNGMSAQDLDQMIGHEQDKPIREDYLSAEATLRMAKIIDRCVYFGETVPSFNAACRTYELNAGTRLECAGNTELVFEVTEDLQINLFFESVGRDDVSLTFEFPEGASKPRNLSNKIRASSRRDPSWSIILQQPSELEISSWIAEANVIDLSELAEKYKDK